MLFGLNILLYFVIIPVLMLLGLFLCQKDNMKQIRTVAVVGSTLLVALSVYLLVDYLALRAAGDTKTPMKVGVGVNIINVVLSYLLIYPVHDLTLGTLTITVPGFGLGVIGAAIASAVAFAVGGIYMTVVFWKHPVISPKGHPLKPDKEKDQ